MNKREPVTETIHGIEVTDPYRWLEDSDDPDVKEWIDEQNQRVDTELKNEVFDTFSAELVENFKVTNFSTPLAVNGRYFYMERRPDQDRAVLYYRDGLDGEPTIIFDPNGSNEENTATIDYWYVSHNGQLVAYGISKDGDEMATLFIKDLETGKNLEEVIPQCRHSSLEWLSDDSGFYYTRHPDPSTVPDGEEHMHSKVYLHNLGDDPSEDKLIFGKGRPKDDMIGISLSPDDKYLGLMVSHNWTENNVFIYNTETEELRQLTEGDGFYCGVFFLEDKVLMYTTYEADNSRILFNTYEDIFKPIEEWEEFVPEREYPLLGYWVTKNKVITHHLVDVSSEVAVFNHDGEKTGEIPLPEHASLIGLLSRRDEEEFFYSFNSFIEPRTTNRFNPEDDEYSEYRQEENPLDPADYIVSQEWCQSKGGTRVPMFILRHKDVELDGTNPTILTGYGAHGTSYTPSFARNRVPWLERGGVYVVANVRGGGEFGKSWQEAGAKENKSNTIADFIAAAEYLIDQGYTSSEHIGSLGASNGGPLVATAAVQRPELFAAVCAQVPVLDMLRFHKFGMAVRWTHEFGNPEDPDDFKRLLTWSPYHNIEKGQEYPHFLLTTADGDTRVHPLHARKMGARLQEEAPAGDTYVFTEMNVGHGGGMPIKKVVESRAVVYSFFAQKLGMKV